MTCWTVTLEATMDPPIDPDAFGALIERLERFDAAGDLDAAGGRFSITATVGTLFIHQSLPLPRAIEVLGMEIVAGAVDVGMTVPRLVSGSAELTD